jgi:hypothetical protein
MNERIVAELALLRGFYPDLDYLEAGHWVRLTNYLIPGELWSTDRVDVCFQVPAGLPGQAPYAFHAQPQLTLADGSPPDNYTWPGAPTGFSGQWGTFSWALDPWQPVTDPANGSNMVGFARTIADRFRQGR